MGLFKHKAVKERLKARVAIDGPTGAGKTWTALQWGTVIADGAPIGLIDTENRSAAYYAAAPDVEPNRVNPWDPPYDFYHLPVAGRYDPRELAQMIDAAADDLGEDGVLIIDSLTHYWFGEGGTLDIVDNAASRSGNSFAGWKEGTPAQRFMLDKIVHAPFHVIVTMRSKMEYVLEAMVKNGKTIQVPKKVGMAPEQRAGIEYEFTVVADMDLEHRLIVSKSRCDVIADVVAPSGRSVDVAKDFAKWLGTGVARISTEQAATLSAAFDAVHDEDDRKEAKRAFVTQFGRPADLTVDRFDAARDWIDSMLMPPAQDTGTPSVHGPTPAGLLAAVGETLLSFDDAADIDETGLDG